MNLHAPIKIDIQQEEPENDIRQQKHSDQNTIIEICRLSFLEVPASQKENSAAFWAAGRADITEDGQ